MCGILALCNLDGTPVDPDVLRHLRDVMTHRGPDDAGLYTDGPLGLGHRRLSIVDLTPSGHQPMCNEDGSVWMVFNGEVYNYVELAVDLERRGHECANVVRRQAPVQEREVDPAHPECLHTGALRRR